MIPMFEFSYDFAASEPMKELKWDSHGLSWPWRSSEELLSHPKVMKWISKRYCNSVWLKLKRKGQKQLLSLGEETSWGHELGGSPPVRPSFIADILSCSWLGKRLLVPCCSVLKWAFFSHQMGDNSIFKILVRTYKFLKVFVLYIILLWVIWGFLILMIL